MADRVTRASNAHAHPGMVDCGPMRRSKEEVEKDKQAKAAAKAQAEKQKAANIQRVAELESAMKRKTRDTEQHANDPLEKDSQPQAKRTRNQHEIVNKGITHTHDTQLTDNALTWTHEKKTSLKRFLRQQRRLPVVAALIH
jgi:hypothetical protein